MPKHDLSSRHFQRKISEFCEVRIAPISSKRVLENIRPYLIRLIICRKRPPILNGHLDWAKIGEACRIEDQMTAELKKQLQLGLDAIIRWLKAPPVSKDTPPAKLSARTSKAEAVKKTAAASSNKKTQRTAAEGVFARDHLRNAGRHRSQSAHFQIRYSRRPTIRQAFRMRSSTICAGLATATGSFIALSFI